MNNLSFRIEQIAIAPKNSKAAIALLAALGLTDWVKDTVSARGEVRGVDGAYNAAELSFNYQAAPDDGKLEFEVLDYKVGPNWLAGKAQSVSHLGMHCTDEELEEWRKVFEQHKIGVAQEVKTEAHSNPAIKDSRRYHYVIFDTRHILGVDLKFIVRHDI
jgi:hypothetical protein